MPEKVSRFSDLIDWPMLLDDNNLESAEAFWELDSKVPLEVQTIILHKHFVKRLAGMGIDPETFKIDLLSTPPETIALVVECIGYGNASRAYESGNWSAAVSAINRSHERANRMLAERRVRLAEAARRAEVSRGGAIAKARNQRDVIDDAIALFDPGKATGKSKSSRAQIILNLAKAAKAQGKFPDAERLPKSLRKYLR